MFRHRVLRLQASINQAPHWNSARNADRLPSPYAVTRTAKRGDSPLAVYQLVNEKVSGSIKFDRCHTTTLPFDVKGDFFRVNPDALRSYCSIAHGRRVFTGCLIKVKFVSSGRSAAAQTPFGTRESTARQAFQAS